MRALLTALLALAVWACAVPTGESNEEIVDEPEATPLGHGHSCPYMGTCPNGPQDSIFMYWIEGTDVTCYYRQINYPYAVTMITVTDGGCETDCCATGQSPPCSDTLNYTTAFTCY